jgi:hypothetical protein
LQINKQGSLYKEKKRKIGVVDCVTSLKTQGNEDRGVHGRWCQGDLGNLENRSFSSVVGMKVIRRGRILSGYCKCCSFKRLCYHSKLSNKY